MSVIESYENVLKQIETAVVQVWRKQPAMTNYAVMRVYEAATERYRAEALARTPKNVALTGVEAELLEAVRTACDTCLREFPSAENPAQSMPAEDMVACLRRLSKSVDFWTKQGGRQGYMQYIEGFVP